VRALVPGDESLLSPLLAEDPVGNCFVAARVEAGGLSMSSLGGSVLGYEREDRLVAALYVGANLIPISTDEQSRAELAHHAVRIGRRSSSIVGPADEVLPLWALLRPYWGAARDVRPDQPLMVAVDPPRVAPDPLVRRSTITDLETVFPACIDMFTEEVGVSPTAGGAGPAYQRRVAELIREGRSFARFEGGRPIFKAELGAVAAGACQIQGVWVHPDHRGRGLASAGMAAVTGFAADLSQTVSLYVNSYNTRALSAYHSAGFRTVGTFATVLF
jgi:hypothetical protein